MRKKTEARRQAIIDVAASTFRELGFENTSMAEISSRLGGSKATLYSYFSSKEEIFAEVLTQQIGGARQASIEIQSQKGDLREILLRVGINYLQVMFRSENIAVRRLINYHAERSNLGRIIYANGPRANWQSTADMFETRITEGELRAADAWLMAMQFRALLEAEWMEKRMLGIVMEVTLKEIEAASVLAVDTFLAAYSKIK